MGSRGRGRGGGRNVSFNIESLGLNRADMNTMAAIGLKHHYPGLHTNVTPLLKTARMQFILALKQDQRSSLQASPYYIKPIEKRMEISRYSDKYRKTKSLQSWYPEWNRIPKELRINLKRKSLTQKSNLETDVDISHHVNNLDKGEEDDEEDEDNKAGEHEINEEIEEEDMEEDNDYNITYFDNGEGDADDADDNNEPTY